MIAENGLLPQDYVIEEVKATMAMAGLPLAEDEVQMLIDYNTGRISAEDLRRIIVEKAAAYMATIPEEGKEESFNELKQSIDSINADFNMDAVRGSIAMRSLQIQAEKHGISDMTLDEINAEIDAARQSRK